MTTPGTATQWLATFHLPLGHLGYTFKPVCIVGIGPLIGEKGSNIHPPKLVEGPSDEGLRERTGELKYPLPQYSIYSLPDQIRRGEQPRLGGKPIGFVPYKGLTSVTGGSPRNPGFDLYLPIGGGMAITQMSAWYVPDKSLEGHSMVQVMLDLWKTKYGTSFYDIDTVTGQVYIIKDRKNNSNTREMFL